MHLLVPHAGLPPTLADSAAWPELPHLQTLLTVLIPQPGAGDEMPKDADENSLSPPHERALAALWQWPFDDGLLPFAARAAAADGLQAEIARAGPDVGWGLLRPTYWHLGTERVSLTDPDDLQLTDTDSRALFDAVAGLFDGDGWALHWGASTRWYAVHASLRQLPTASIDRVVGRNIDGWLKLHPQARAVRRLQSEVQMSLHQHPVNEARVSNGLAPVNSFWLSGTGVTRAATAVPDLQVENGLRHATLAADADGWLSALRGLDRGPLAVAAAAAQRGESVRLTLCGEHACRSLATPLQPRWRRWRRWMQRRPDMRTMLSTL